MNTTAETVSSCVKFASSLKTAVGFAVLASNGAAIREGIENGKWEGISFPEPQERMKRKSYSNAQRIDKMSEINRLRDCGGSLSQSCVDAGISTPSYEKWSSDLGIKYAEKVFDKHPHDIHIANMVKGGENVESACATFGIKSGAWRYRAVKKGLYSVDSSKIRPIKFYEDGVSRVLECIRETGCTVRLACKKVQFAEHNFHRYKLLAKR